MLASLPDPMVIMRSNDDLVISKEIAKAVSEFASSLSLFKAQSSSNESFTLFSIRFIEFVIDIVILPLYICSAIVRQLFGKYKSTKSTKINFPNKIQQIDRNQLYKREY